MNYLQLIFVLLLTATSTSTWAQRNMPQTTTVQQDSARQIIEKFVQDLNNPALANDVILSQHILLQQPLTDEFFEYLSYSIATLRLNIQQKDLSQLRYIPFIKLPKKDIRDIDLEGNDPQAIYFIKYRDKLVFPVLLKDGKIKSFTLVSNGEYAHFINY